MLLLLTSTSPTAFPVPPPPTPRKQQHPNQGREPGVGAVTGEDAGAHCISFVSDAPGNGLRSSQPFPIRPVVFTPSHPIWDKGCRQAGAWESSKGADWPSWGIVIPFRMRGRHKNDRGLCYP